MGRPETWQALSERMNEVERELAALGKRKSEFDPVEFAKLEGPLLDELDDLEFRLGILYLDGEDPDRAD